MQTQIGEQPLSFYPIIDCNYDTYKNFRCKNSSMESFLRTEARLSHLEKDSSTTLVFVEDEIIGYFTLRHQEVAFETDDEIHTEDCLEIARIAILESKQGLGFGQLVVSHIIDLAYMFNEKYIVGAALTEVVDWYRSKFQFKLMIEDEFSNIENEPITFIYLNLEFADLLEEYYNNP
ncbi:MAG: GNAT family N-acetyltransferase [Firmicutes bacterium]|nr:GNAT family N-acetyltransferase [Bacillota bacterium]